MKKITSFLIGLLAVMSPSLALAQSIGTTDLSAAVSTATATTLTVTSGTAISPSQWLYIDREAMRVTNVSGNTVTVVRGIDGIPSAHNIGAAVYYGTPSAFFSTSPANPSCSPSTQNIYINVSGGDMYICVNSLWRSLNIIGPAPVGTVLVGNGASVPPTFSSNGGTVTFTRVLVGDGTAVAPSYSFTNYTGTGWYTASGNLRGSISGTSNHLFTSTTYRIESNSATIMLGSSSDVQLTWHSANALALRNGSNAQDFYVGPSGQGVYLGGTSVDGRLRAVNGPLYLGANNTLFWVLNTAGTILPQVDGSYDIGSASFRPAWIYSTKFTSRIASGNGGTAGNRTHANISIGSMGVANDIGQITFGYASDGSTTYQPISLYAKTVSAAGSTNATFNIAVRALTTDTAPVLATTWNTDGTVTFTNSIKAQVGVYGDTGSSLPMGGNFTTQWRIATDGTWRAEADNTYPIGTSSNYRPSYVYVGTAFGTDRVIISAGLPTISSGFGTGASRSGGTAAAFTINVGTGGTASSGVIGMPTASNGWSCSVTNQTAVAANRADQHTVQTASTSTTVTVQNQTVSTGAALAWAASDILSLVCLAR